MSRESSARPGALALVGSGEYTEAMEETDRYLLDTLGGAEAARVALLPTASGLEPDGPSKWNAMGERHFARLGVRDIRATQIIDAASAHAPAQLALLDGANFFYFSGGSPQHVIASMHGTPAWEHISAAFGRGAVLAGCSAGAMAFGGYTANLRTIRAGGRANWVPALGVVPKLIVFPHFDRIFGVLSRSALQTHLLTVPPDSLAIGIDEDTALVRLLAPGDASHDASDALWRVMGRQGVTLFRAQARMLRAGDEVRL